MAETNFIKTVAFGGYDKAETEKLFEAMNQRICDLQNEMIQNKLLLNNYKSDSDEVKNFEAVLSAERSKLSQLQVQNETLTAKNRDLSSEMRDKELKIKELKASVADLKKKLSYIADATDSDSSAVAMSKAFLEAQRSSDEMLDRARDEAEVLRKNAVRLAESIIDEANEKAERIISEAKRNTLPGTVFVQDGNSILSENFGKLGSQLGLLKKLISDFESSGMEYITQCEDIISDTAESMKNIPTEKAADSPATPVKVTVAKRARSAADTPDETPVSAVKQDSSDSPEIKITDSKEVPDKKKKKKNKKNIPENQDIKEPVSDQPADVSAEKADENDSSYDQSEDLKILMAMAEALNDD